MSGQVTESLGVFVLGMHRSGTSAAARLVNLLGFSLGPDRGLLPPQEDNPTGFWESESLMQMNDRLLDALGGAWDAPPALEPGWLARPEVEALRPSAIAILQRVLIEDRWAWKDPRNCLTLPFWLTSLRARTAIVLIHRNPLEVAASLQARNGFATPLGLALWERYMRSALAAVCGRPVFITSYRRLIDDPHAWTEALAVFLRECGVYVPEPPRPEIESFVRPELRHAEFPDTALGANPLVSMQQHNLHLTLEAAAGAHRRFSAAETGPETPWVDALLAERRHGRRQERELAAAEASLVGRTAIVIVNTNGGDYLPRALAAVERQTASPDRVIVVDNGSTDGSADGLEERHPGVEVVRAGTNLGFAAANNLAARLADDCAYIALLNPDAFPEPGWLAALLHAAARHPGYSFFASRLLRDGVGRIDGTGDCIHVSGMVWSRDRDQPADFDRAAGEVFAACAAAALYRRDAFLSVGGFDESFFCFHEDSDLSFRLQLAGYRCLYVPEAAVRHVGSALTGAQSDFTLYHSFRNQIWFWVKNMPLGLLLIYLPQHLLMNALTLASYMLRRRPRVVLRAQFDAVRGLPNVIARRRETQARRLRGSLELRSALERGPLALIRESPSLRAHRRD